MESTRVTFKKGDRVKCITGFTSSYGTSITEGKVYEVLDCRDGVHDKLIDIINDKGDNTGWYVHRFELVDDSTNARDLTDLKDAPTTGPFKPGDIVRCIEGYDRELIAGNLYTVEAVTILGDIRVQGIRTAWRAERFEGPVGTDVCVALATGTAKFGTPPIPASAAVRPGVKITNIDTGTKDTKLVLPTDSASRKGIPLVRGVLDYFPAALVEVAKLSKAGNDKHNPGEDMHHARGKSTDHADCILKHLVDRGLFDPEDGIRHSVKVAWRALALLQEELEAAGLAPLARGAKL